MKNWTSKQLKALGMLLALLLALAVPAASVSAAADVYPNKPLTVHHPMGSGRQQRLRRADHRHEAVRTSRPGRCCGQSGRGGGHDRNGNRGQS